MKKLLIIVLSLVVLLVIALAVLPYVYKDEIKAAVDEQLASSVNADVIYDIDNFSLSVFKNFPNITAGVEELGVVGRDQFAGEVLFAVRNLEIEINLSKILFGDQLSIQSIYLDEPHIFIKVLEDGTANYDIAIADTTATEERSDESATFNMAIEYWQIKNGTIIYDDATIPFYMELANVDHDGGGDFSLTVFDMVTNTSASVVDITYDGVSYLSNRALDADVTVSMDLDEMKFTFKENEVGINDFKFGFDGWLAMPSDPIDMNISFNAKDNSFKSLISLIPAIYSSDFEKLTATGKTSFGGKITGRYDEKSMPAFSIALGIKDGMFKYPDLPEAISNVQLDMKIINEDGNIDYTVIEINSMHIDLGNNPIDASLKLDNFIDFPLKAFIKARLDLASISNFYPVQGLTMKGILNATLNAEGTYDSIKAIIPAIDAVFSLTNGYFNYDSLPVPISDFALDASVINKSGRMADTRIDISSVSANIGTSPLTGKLKIEGLEDFQWDTELKGVLDFDNLFPLINQVYPMPGTVMGGQIDVRVLSSGKMSDLDAGRYDRLPASGRISFKNFSYSDSINLPQGMVVSEGSFSLTPQKIILKDLKVNAGESDFESNGSLTNYMGYILQDKAVLSGNLVLNSNNLNVNEWMAESSDQPVEETEVYTVIEVPKNIDFTMQAKLKRIVYENLELKNASGTILVKNGVVDLRNLSTSTLGGVIVFNGTYDTRNMSKPQYDMGLSMKNISIQESFKAFSTVQALAPIAQHVIGDVSTDFKIKGLLKEDMMPDLGTIRGEGLLEITKAALAKASLINGLTQFTKAKSTNEINFKDLLLSAKIANGRLSIAPFDVPIGGFLANVNGSTGFDGSLDYDVSMKVPAGQIGSQVNSLISSITGGTNTGEEVTIIVGLGGTYDKPSFSLKGADSKDLVKKAAAHQITKLIGGDTKKTDSLQAVVSRDSINKQFEEQKKEVARQAQVEKDSLEAAAKKELESVKKKAAEASDEVSKKINSLFKKKKKNN